MDVWLGAGRRSPVDSESQEGLEPPQVNTSDPSLQSLVPFKHWVLEKRKQNSFK